MLREENMKLGDEIAQLEQRDLDINEQVRQMTEQAEMSLKQRQQFNQQQQRKPDQQQTEDQLNSKMEPAPLEGSIDETNNQ